MALKTFKMKFLDLIKSNSWLSVEMVFSQSYPGEKSNMAGYEKVFNALRFLEVGVTDITILVSHIKDDFDNEEYVSVSGYYSDADKSANELTNSLALGFTPWEEWLGMRIDEQSLIDFSELEIICHFLYEMTFYGFEQEEIQNEIGRVNNIVDEIKNMPPDEKERNLISMDEFLNEIKNIDKGPESVN